MMDHDPRYGPSMSYYTHQNYPPERQVYHSNSTSPVDQYGNGVHSPYGYMYSASDESQLRSPHSATLYPHLPPAWPPGTASDQGNLYPPASSYQPARAMYPPPSQYMPFQGPPIRPASSPPTPAPATPTPRRTLTDADRKRMCQYAEENPSKKQTEIGEAFGVERSTVSKVLRQKEKYLLPEGERSPRKRPRIQNLQKTLANWLANQLKEGMHPSDAAILQQARTLGAVVPALAQSQLALHEPNWLNDFKINWRRYWAEHQDSTTSSSTSKDLESSSVPPAQDTDVSSDVNNAIPASSTSRSEQVAVSSDSGRKEEHGLGTAIPPPTACSPLSAQSVAAPLQSPWGPPHHGASTQYAMDQLPPYASSYPPPPSNEQAAWPPPYSVDQSRLQATSQQQGYTRRQPPPLKPPPATDLKTHNIKRELEPSTPLGNLPSYDEAQEALKTLQRYVRNVASGLQPDEKDLIQSLNALKLKPSIPELPKHSTGTELGAGKRKVKRAKSQHLQ